MKVLAEELVSEEVQSSYWFVSGPELKLICTMGQISPG